MDSLITPATNVRDVKHYGKSFMFDNDEETCWNSDQGSPQFIHIEFPKHVLPKAIILKFQGGFAGKECSVKVMKQGENWTDLLEFYPKDISTEQIFEIFCKEYISKMRIYFNTSTDFFGRVTIYKLDVLGHV